MNEKPAKSTGERVIHAVANVLSYVVGAFFVVAFLLGIVRGCSFSGSGDEDDPASEYTRP